MTEKGLQNVSTDLSVSGQPQYNATISGKRKTFELWELGFELLGEEPLPMLPICTERSGQI